VRITVRIDGHEVDEDVAAGETLLEFLRRRGTVAVKDGCGTGDCGSCAVLLDGRAVTSCLVFAAQAGGRTVTTAAGLADADGLHPLQQALLDAGGVQCGFCTPGVLVAAVDLLSRDPDPSERDVRVALEGNLCRCTGYVKIVEGVREAARAVRDDRGEGVVTDG
jgi:aerobic carbon-monoxide dehydrogenase small subunit